MKTDLSLWVFLAVWAMILVSMLEIVPGMRVLTPTAKIVVIPLAVVIIAAIVTKRRF